MIPGYKHVETFGPDEDYESEEDVEYVTLDLGTIEPTLVPSSSTYRLVVSHILAQFYAETDMRRMRDSRAWTRPRHTSSSPERS